MLVWGGEVSATLGVTHFLNDGGRYNPVAHVWTPITTNGAPSARSHHTAVWTGTEMIIWGGATRTATNDGGRYNPAANVWTVVTTNGAPGARSHHTAVWTGTEMIVWGGGTNGTGGRYNPAGNTWTDMTTNGAPAARSDHTAVWTGTEMIVWGGTGTPFGFPLNTGGRYNPAGNTWTDVATNGAPAARDGYTAVWTGTEMIIWGAPLNGGRYNPISNGWTPTSSGGGVPIARFDHTAVWTGTEMIIWGGFDKIGNTFLNDGARYNPVSDSWTATSASGAPFMRERHTAIWTGSEMIIWGGVIQISASKYGYSNETSSYTPGRNMFLYQRP
jgi:N-acetylneuraminic acid mutarotase